MKANQREMKGWFQIRFRNNRNFLPTTFLGGHPSPYWYPAAPENENNDAKALRYGRNSVLLILKNRKQTSETLFVEHRVHTPTSHYGNWQFHK